MTERSSNKIRLDERVQRVADVSRSQAQGLIRAGKVTTPDGHRLDKPGQAVEPKCEIRIAESPRYVSRGGLKLEAALTHFPIDVEGRIALDVGASTGGFTDCLLQHGARKVYAVDVGYGQIDWKLRQDPRVTVRERTNIRNLDPAQLDEAPDFFTVDCSFISLRLVLSAVRPLLARGAEGVVLIKPQFEAGRDQVSKGGVVRDPAVRDAVVREVIAAAGTLGFNVRGVIRSPVQGPAGNVEFLAHVVLIDERPVPGDYGDASDPAHPQLRPD